MARIFRRRIIIPASTVTVIFNSSQSWTVPTGVTNLVTMSGKGQKGTSGLGDRFYTTYTYVTVTYEPGYGTNSEAGPNYAGKTYSSTTPADYCTTEYESFSRKTTRVCYSHYTDFDEGTPTTGASTTFIGSTVNKAFPGTTGNVTVPTTTFNNTAVTAGEVVTVTVPTSGTLTITYLSP